MATIVLGCDENGNDIATRDTVADILRKAGNTVEVLDVGPGNIQPAMMQSSCKGKISVYLQANSLETYADWEDGIKNGYYHVKYAYFGLRGDIPELESCREPGFHTMKLTHDNDRSDGYEQRYAGMTPKEISEKCKQYYTIVPGSSAKEIGENLVKAMGGETTSSTSKSNGSSIKSAIKQVLYGWNGDAECYLKDDTIYINKIRDPTSAKLKLIEGDNVFLDGVSLTDIDPNTPNKLIVKWKNNSFIIKDDARIKRFGEVSKTIKSSNKSEKDAVAFAYHEWNKLLKDDGRKLECKVDGDPKWRIGQWVRVYLPSFNLNGYMYLTKVSHDDDGKWKTNLTLEDYPPDLGEKPSETKTDSNSSSTSSSDSSSSSDTNNSNSGDS